MIKDGASLANNNQNKITRVFVENREFNGKDTLNNENGRKSFLLSVRLISTCVLSTTINPNTHLKIPLKI